MNLNWKDCTSYSQGDDKKIARTWELILEELNYRVVVTRHIYYKNTWVLTCKKADIECFDLKTDDVNEAKNKALEIIKDYLNKLVDRAMRQVEILKSI